MGFAKPIEQYLFGNQIHVFMYLKDIIRERPEYDLDVQEQVNINIKYEGYIK